MKHSRHLHQRASELRQQRLLEAQEAAAQRRQQLLDDVAEIAVASIHDPSQVGEYVDQLASAGLLGAGDEALIRAHLVQVAGSDFAEAAFAPSSTSSEGESQEILGALVDEWRSARARMERGRRGNIVDVDAKRAEKTMQLVERIAGFLGLPNDEIEVRADEVAAQKTAARGASGLMDGGVVYLNPSSYDPDTSSGRYLLGHEMVHVAQRSETSAGSGLRINKSGAEAEAADMGRRFAAGQSITRPQFGLPAMDKAADTDADSSSGGGKPSDFRLSLAGQRFRIRLPDSAQPGAKFTVRDLNISVGPLTITEAELKFKDDWSFEEGKVKASVSAGEGINIDNVELQVNREKQVSATLENVQIQLGTYISATMNLTITSAGVNGTATIQPSDVTIPGGVSFTGGEINLTVAEGSMSASGRVTATVAGVGELAFEASFAQGGGDAGADGGGASVSGSVEINLQENLQITEGITLNSAKITGSFSEEKGYETSGKVGVTVDGWGTADIEVGYKKPMGEAAKDLWTVKGRLEQEKGSSFTVGTGEDQLTISKGHIEVDYTDNTLKEVGGGCAFDHAHFSGEFTGTYKVQEKLFSGSGDATLKQPITLGEGGGAVTIHEASGGATIEENKVTHVRVKSARADLPYDGQKTFEITVKDADFKVKEKELTGSGSVKTYRDLTFGDTAKQHVKLAAGANGNVTVEKNVITAINGGIAFSVREGEGEIGNGTINVDFTNSKSGGDPKINANGTFNLSSDYGYPDKANGPLMVKSGSTFKVDVKNNAIDSVELENVTFELTNSLEGQTGKISGSLEGKADFASGKLDCKGSCKVDETWTLTEDWGAVEFLQGGDLKVEVEESQLKHLEGKLEFKAGLAGYSEVILIEGKAEGKYEQSSGVFDGSFDTKLKSKLTIPLSEGGADKVVVKEGAKVDGKVKTGELAEIGIDVDFEYHRAGSVFLTGSIKDGKYDIQNKQLTVAGKAKIHEKIEKATTDGKWKLVIKKDAEIEIDIQANNLTRVGGNVEFEIFKGETVLAKGHLREADVKDGSFTGEFEVKLVDNLDWPGPESRPKDSSGKQLDNAFEVVVKKDSLVSGKIATNAVSSVHVELDSEVKLGGQQWATGSFNGDWNVANDEFSCDFEFKTVQPLGGTRDEANMAAGGKDRIPAWGWLLPAGQEISGKVVKNAFQKATVNLNAQVFGPEGPGQILGTATCKGSLEVGDEPTKGFEGEVTINVAKTTTISNRAEGSTDFEIWIREGSNFKAKWEHAAFKSADGTFKLSARQGGEDRIHVDLAAKWAPQTGVNGTGTIDVKKDFLIADRAPYKLHLKQGSGGKGKVDSSKLTELNGDITLSVSKSEKEFAKGVFKADYKLSDGGDASINAKGVVELTDELNATPEGSEYKFFVRKGAGITLELADSKLKYIEGTIDGGVADAKHEFINFNCWAKYEEPGKFDAKGQVKVIDQHDFWTRGDYKAYLKVGDGAEFKVEGGKLIEVTAKIPMGLSDKDGELIKVELNGKYDHQAKRFDGEGTASLARKLTIAENVAILKDTYSFYLEKSTGITAKIENNEFTYAKGNLDVKVHDSEAEFLHFNGNVTYKKEAGAQEAKVDADKSTTKVKKDKPLVQKQEQGFDVVLKKQDGPTLDIKENSLQEISGSVKVEVVKGEEKWVEATLAGKYTPDGGFEGSAKATLCKTIDVAKKVAGKYDLVVQPGTGAEVTFEKSKIKHIGGTVTAKVNDPEGEFVQISAKADYDYPNKKFSATGQLNVLNPRKLAQIGNFKLNLAKTTGIQGEVKDNEPKWIEGAINLSVDEGTAKLADAKISGKWDIDKGKFSGEGTFTLVRDFKLSANDQDSKLIEQWGLYLTKGSGVGVKVVNNEFQPATVDVKAHLNKGAEKVAEGGVKGTYTIGDEKGFSGSVDFHTIKRIEWEKGDRFTTHIDTGTGFKGTATDSQVDSVSGKFVLVATEGSDDKIKAEAEGTYAKGKGVSGSGSVKVLGDVLISTTSGGYSLYLAKDSGGQAVVKDNVLESISGTVKLRLDKGTEPVALGDFQIDYKISEGDKAKVTSTGTVKIVGEVDMTPQGVGSKNHHFWLVGGTGVSLKVTDSDLDWVDGSLKVRIDEGADPIIDVDITGKYVAGESPDFNGTGTASTRRAIDLGVQHKGYSLWLDQGAGAGIKITAMKLDELNANVPLLIKNPEQKNLWKIGLNGTYKHAEGGAGKFSGNGKAELLIAFEVAKNVGGYDFWLEPGTGATVTVTDNSIEKATGTLKASVADSEGKFLKAEGEAEYSNSGDTGTLVKLNGKLEVTREKQMLSTAKGFVAWLEKGSKATVDISNNKVDKIGGVINVRLDQGAEKFVQIELSGEYTEASGFSGKGKASLLCEEYFVNEVGKYKVYVTKSEAPLAEVTLANSDITHVGGTVNGRIDDEEGAFVKFGVKADYAFETKNFSGDGSAEIVGDRKLAEVTTSQGPESLWLCKGTGATVKVLNNALQQVGGKINLDLKDAQDTYVKVELKGTFDAVGGTGFTGEGSTTVTRDKKLAEVAGYQFWLAPGAGAHAKISQNKLEEVGGKVPFKIFTPDNQSEPLIVGACEGKYLSKTGKFTGSGDIRLGRNVEFDLGGGAKLVFKKGSGGNASVTDNELRKLGGRLDVDIWDSKGALVNVAAEGEYDAVENNLIRVEGEAKLLRKMELLDGNIILHEAKGNALVENNQLKSGHVEATIEIVPLNNMKGHIEVDFCNEGNGWEYWGSGWVDFTLIEPDAATGRYMGGKVNIDYKRDNTFVIDGQVDYKINEMIGGKIDVKVDQTLDPVIGASFSLSNVELVKGKKLFEKELDLIPRTDVMIFPPAALNLFFGVRGGAGLDLRPLLFSATIGFQGWRPLSAASTVPDFEVDLALNWGLDFQAMVAAYMGLSLGIQGFNVGAGVEGQLLLDIPIEVAPHGKLRGSKEGFSGELGIGISIAPSLKAKAIPFVSAVLGPLDFRHEFTEWEIPLGELFKWEWGTKYEFGDRPASTQQGANQKAPAGTESQKAGKVEGEPKFPQSAGPADNVKGGPQLESGQEMSNKGQTEQGSGGEMAQKMEDIKALGEGVGALAKLFQYLIGCLTALATAGLAGLAIYLVIEIVFGDLSWSGIVEAVQAVVRAMRVAARLLEPHLPDWVKGIIDFATGERPSLMDALFGADDKAREEVRKGTHRDLPAKARAKFIDMMIDGYTGEADQDCILEILRFSSSKGDIGSVVSMVNGGADQILSDLDGSQDSESRRLFDRAGISY